MELNRQPDDAMSFYRRRVELAGSDARLSAKAEARIRTIAAMPVRCYYRLVR